MIDPTVARLLLTLPYDLDGARAAAGPACEAVARLGAAFEARAVAMPQRGDGAVLVDDMRAALARLAEACAQVSATVATAAPTPAEVDDLRTAAEQAAATLERLDGWDLARDRLAPIPAIDRFLATGMNVRDHRVDAGALREQVPDLVRMAATLTADLERFRLLYPTTPAPAEAYLAELRKIQAGVNAARAWTASGADHTLLDALRLLHSGGNGLLQPLQDMDAHVRGQSRFSRVVALEETLRCAEAVRGGQLSPAVFAQAVAHLEGLVDFLGGAAEAGAAFPLAFAIGPHALDLDEQVRRLRVVADPWFERARTAPELAAGDTAGLEALQAAVETASGAQQRLQAEIEGLLGLFAGATQLLDVVATLARAARGEAPAELARQHAAAFLERLQALQHELAAQGPGQEAFETRALLADQAEALGEMLLVLDDGDEAHLRDGLQRLRGVLPRLDEMQRGLREGAEAQRRAREQGVSCFRCGAANGAGQRYCSACNAVLPVQVPEETVYTDIVGGEEALQLPENLQTLQNLYVLAESGGDGEQILADLAGLHATLHEVARQYDEGIAARRDALPPNAAEYGQAFAEHLQQLIEAVETMYNGMQHGSLDHMGRGLQMALSAGQELQDLQLHMQEHAVG